MVSVNGKRTGIGQRFVLIYERSIKELTRASDSSPSWQFLKTNRFGDANRRGSPSKIEGLGSWMKGVKGKGSPCRFGQSPRFFCHAGQGSANAEKPRRARPNEIWYNVLDHIL